MLNLIKCYLYWLLSLSTYYHSCYTTLRLELDSQPPSSRRHSRSDKIARTRIYLDFLVSNLRPLFHQTQPDRIALTGYVVTSLLILLYKGSTTICIQRLSLYFIEGIEQSVYQWVLWITWGNYDWFIYCRGCHQVLSGWAGRATPILMPLEVLRCNVCSTKVMSQGKVSFRGSLTSYYKELFVFQWGDSDDEEGLGS